MLVLYLEQTSLDQNTAGDVSAEKWMNELLQDGSHTQFFYMHTHCVNLGWGCQLQELRWAGSSGYF